MCVCGGKKIYLLGLIDMGLEFLEYFFKLTITEHCLFLVVIKQLMDGLSQCNLLSDDFDWDWWNSVSSVQ